MVVIKIINPIHIFIIHRPKENGLKTCSHLVSSLILIWDTDTIDPDGGLKAAKRTRWQHTSPCAPSPVRCCAQIRQRVESLILSCHTRHILEV